MTERGRPLCAVVVPAFNEEAVIDRCLAALLEDAHPGELEVVVVPNGCTDATADRARQHAVRVVELDEGNKAAALNAGDHAATAFPRLYLDGDLELPTADVRALVEELERSPAVLALAARREHDLDDVSWPVRAYTRTWDALHNTPDLIGGAYVLSHEGRARFAEFPQLVADDLFVRSRFAGDERRVSRTATVRVTPPRHLGELVRQRARIYRGLDEIVATGTASADDFGHNTSLQQFARRGPGPFVHALVYAAITVAARALAARQERRGVRSWARAESTRR